MKTAEYRKSWEKSVHLQDEMRPLTEERIQEM